MSSVDILSYHPPDPSDPEYLGIRQLPSGMVCPVYRSEPPPEDISPLWYPGAQTPEQRGPQRMRVTRRDLDERIRTYRGHHPIGRFFIYRAIMREGGEVDISEGHGGYTQIGYSLAPGGGVLDLEDMTQMILGLDPSRRPGLLSDYRGEINDPSIYRITHVQGVIEPPRPRQRRYTPVAPSHILGNLCTLDPLFRQTR